MGGKPAWGYASRPTDDAIAKNFTKEALSFVPVESDIFITNSKGASQRLIFHEPLALKDHEKEHI